MIPPNFYRVSVKGLIIDDQRRILLTREIGGKWELLGGGLDYGENPLAGLKREIEEETDLEVTIVSPSPRHLATAIRNDGETWGAYIAYEVKLASLDFTPSDECQELRWFTLQEARETPNVFPNIVEMMEDLGLGEPAVG